MNIAVMGAGNIGTTLARQFARQGHQVTLAFSHDEQRLQALAHEIGHHVRAASPAAAASLADVVVLSVPWEVIDVAIAQMGDVTGKVVIDTTNHFSQGLVDLGGVSSLAYNQRRLPGAKVAKAFNTITAGYQAEVAAGEHRPIAMFYAAWEPEAKKVCSELVSSLGFVPVALDGPAEMLMEAPRRQGAVYGEGYLPADAQKIAETARYDLVKASQLADALKQ
jgi:predicted dinucleotide-binding enzyme